MSLLDITGLSHSYGDSRLYSDSALSLNRGEHMGIVGQNGTGKSTLHQNMHGTGHPRFRPRGLAAGHYHWLSGPVCLYQSRFDHGAVFKIILSQPI
ncbi:MAG: ATP-binding cassette domain-containing protein [Enterocloster sp.]